MCVQANLCILKITTPNLANTNAPQIMHYDTIIIVGLNILINNYNTQQSKFRR